MPVSELGRRLFLPAQAGSEPPLPQEATEIPIKWQWYLKIAFINFMALFVIFALSVLLLEVSMQNSISPILDRP